MVHRQNKETSINVMAASISNMSQMMEGLAKEGTKEALEFSTEEISAEEVQRMREAIGRASRIVNKVYLRLSKERMRREDK
jgi:flavorubredoxin